MLRYIFISFAFLFLFFPLVAAWNFEEGASTTVTANVYSGGNSTYEIFGVCDNSSFLKAGNYPSNDNLKANMSAYGYYNNTLTNSTTLEEDSGVLTVIYGWVYTLASNAVGNLTQLSASLVANMAGNRSEIVNDYGFYNDTTFDNTWNANYSTNVTCLSRPDCLSNITYNGTHSIWY